MSADGYGAMGAAIGTTLTGALVSIGGTIYAKRTALAYVLFNAVAGLLAIGRVLDFLDDPSGGGVVAPGLLESQTVPVVD